MLQKAITADLGSDQVPDRSPDQLLTFGEHGGLENARWVLAELEGRWYLELTSQEGPVYAHAGPFSRPPDARDFRTWLRDVGPSIVDVERRTRGSRPRDA